MSTKMAVSQPWHFSSSGKLPKLEQTNLARRHICPHGQNRHISQGDTPKIYAHVIRTAMSAEWDPHREAPGEVPHLPAGVPRHLSKRLGRVEYTTFKVFRGITEAGCRPLLRQPSSTDQSAALRHADFPWHQPPEALPCWTEDFICPAPTWFRRSFLARRWQLHCPSCCPPDLQIETLGLRFTISHWLLCICVVSLRLLECE